MITVATALTRCKSDCEISLILFDAAFMVKKEMLRSIKLSDVAEAILADAGEDNSLE